MEDPKKFMEQVLMIRKYLDELASLAFGLKDICDMPDDSSETHPLTKAAAKFISSRVFHLFIAESSFHVLYIILRKIIENELDKVKNCVKAMLRGAGLHFLGFPPCLFEYSSFLMQLFIIIRVNSQLSRLSQMYYVSFIIQESSLVIVGYYPRWNKDYFIRWDHYARSYLKKHKKEIIDVPLGNIRNAYRYNFHVCDPPPEKRLFG